MSQASAFIFLTRSCNLSCEHCYVLAEPGLHGHMTLETFQKTLDLLGVTNINDIRLTGGEPTIHPNFRQFLNELSFRGIRPRLITNGIRLVNSRSPASILGLLSGCWISIYGLTQEQHRLIGGQAVKNLDLLLSFAGSHTNSKSWIGISVILTEVNDVALENFIDTAYRYGVRKLRFLFSEPTGRAVGSNTIFQSQTCLQSKARAILDKISEIVTNKDFDSVTLNDPFDLGNSILGTAFSSCLLYRRKMWSFSPSGNIYSCCFNIYKQQHLIVGVDDFDRAVSIMSSEPPGNVFAKRCEGLYKGFWTEEHDRSTYSCPISAVSIK